MDGFTVGGAPRQVFLLYGPVILVASNKTTFHHLYEQCSAPVLCLAKKPGSHPTHPIDRSERSHPGAPHQQRKRGPRHVGDHVEIANTTRRHSILHVRGEGYRRSTVLRGLYIAYYRQFFASVCVLSTFTSTRYKSRRIYGCTSVVFIAEVRPSTSPITGEEPNPDPDHAQRVVAKTTPSQHLHRWPECMQQACAVKSHLIPTEAVCAPPVHYYSARSRRGCMQ